MAYCIQCGEVLELSDRACPACGRAVGESSVGAARERRARPVALRMLGTMAAVVAALLGVAVLVMILRARPQLDRAQLDHVALLASPSLVTVGPGAHPAGGIVVRAQGGALVVVTEASHAPAGRELPVARNGHAARGLGLVIGAGLARDFALVLVPDGASLAAAQARLAPMPKVDDLVVALSPDRRGAGSGHVLSFEDGPGAGTLVDDAPLAPDARGYGLWSADGRLAAVSALDRRSGDGLAVAAQAMFERLLLREVPLVPGASWTETALPLAKGSRVAVVLQGSTAPQLAARLGEHGAVVRGHEVWSGLATLELDVGAPAPLELAGAAAAGSPPARALVVILDRL